MEPIDLNKIRGKWESRTENTFTGGDDTINSIKLVAEKVNELIDSIKYETILNKARLSLKTLKKVTPLSNIMTHDTKLRDEWNDYLMESTKTYGQLTPLVVQSDFADWWLSKLASREKEMLEGIENEAADLVFRDRHSMELAEDYQCSKRGFEQAQNRFNDIIRSKLTKLQ